MTNRIRRTFIAAVLAVGLIGCLTEGVAPAEESLREFATLERGERGERGEPRDPRHEDQESFDVWQGFSHYWKRKGAGHRVPNRLSEFQSFIEHQPPADSEFHMGQATGVDGNFMTPRGYFAHVDTDDLFVEHGEARFAWLDQVANFGVPEARTTRQARVSVQLPDGDRDVAEMFLRGLVFQPRCDEANQPNGDCNGDGVWPVAFSADIDRCDIDVGGRLTCVVTVQLDRGWTPLDGGFQTPPPLVPFFGTIGCEKDLNQRTNIDFRIMYTVVAGSRDELRVERQDPFVRLANTHDDVETSDMQRITKPRDANVFSAFTRVGFELEGTDDRGRYLVGWQFRTNVDDRGTTADVHTVADVAAPWMTTIASPVRYDTRTTTLVLLGSNSRVSQTFTEGEICIDSREGDGEGDGEEQICELASGFSCEEDEGLENEAFTIVGLSNTHSVDCPPGPCDEECSYFAGSTAYYEWCIAECNAACGGDTCSDGVHNGDEFGVDCGGSCPACFSCADGVMNGDETAVDCGGSCGPCTASCPTGTCGGACGLCAGQECATTADECADHLICCPDDFSGSGVSVVGSCAHPLDCSG